MGLDIGLGVLVLLSAVRGYFRGFVLQAIQLGGLIACVYVADPVRSFARPYVTGYLPSMRPDLLDKLLWWTSAIVSFVIMTGLATWMVHGYRRRPLGEPEPNQTDRGAGFMLGAAKGLVAVAFLAAAIHQHALPFLKANEWANRQVEESRALAWTVQYRPAEQIWNAPPVQTFVAHVRRMGLQPAKPEAQRAEVPSEPRREEKPATSTLRTASRPAPLAIPRPDRFNPAAPDFDLDAAVDAIRNDLTKDQTGKSR